MNNLRGVSAGMGYCHISEVDIVLCFFSLLFYFCYLIYIIKLKQYRDK